MSFGDINKIIDIIGLEEDTTDFELWKYLSLNSYLRDYILFCLELAIFLKKDVDMTLLSFTKKFPKNFNKKLLDEKIIKKSDGVKRIIVEDFINTEFSNIDTKGSKYISLYSQETISSIIVKTNRSLEDNIFMDKFYPDYIQTMNDLYVKTKIKLDISSFNRKDNLEENVVYRKLTTKEIFNVENMNFWTIISKPKCPYCKKTKDTLTELNIPFKDITLTPENKEQICKETYQYTVSSKNPKGYNKVPIIFRFDEFIGGNSDLEKRLKVKTRSN